MSGSLHFEAPSALEYFATLVADDATLPVLEAAVLTMFVLPPPFVIPLFMREPEGADRTFVVNTLSLATLVTLVAFTMITVAYRP